MKNQYLKVKDLKEFIKDLDDEMDIYIVGNDEMPIRGIIDISSETRVGYYKELYLDTVEIGK
ncbi:hypothetical protein [Clostridium paraputrificum]|uniref:hypothetical protein n=1 Tax=Clostridium paraputrificum TaxID=29363 RepID=UPI00189FFB34|nr:hypothetical protein [Clostridium paraputrificum]